MSDPMLHPEQVEGAPRPKPAAYRLALYALALGLLGACVVLGLGEAGAAWDRLREAPALDIALMMGTVVGALAVNTWLFWAVIIPFRPHKPVGVGEMGALIAASSLLNYLPMRAGLIGRAAYLKQQHDLPYRLSVVMMLFVAAATAGVYAWMGLATLILRETGIAHGLGGAWLALVGAGVLAQATIGWAIIRYGRPLVPRFLLRYFDDAELAIAWFKHRSAFTGIAVLYVVLAMRGIEVGFVAARLWLAMRILGEPVGGVDAVLIASGGMFVTLATPLPNGLGLRDYLYGAVSNHMALGLVDRGIEAIVFIIAGVAGLAYVHRRTSDSGAERRSDEG